MRKRIGELLLTASVIVWGMWFGGQYFNEARVIPKLLSNPPESVIAYNQIPVNGGLPFFFPLNPLIFWVSLASAIVAWEYARKSRKWLVLTAIIGFSVCLTLVLYLAPLIGSIVRDAKTASSEEIIASANVWKIGNKIRLFVEFAGFICSVIALRTWSAESISNGDIG